MHKRSNQDDHLAWQRADRVGGRILSTRTGSFVACAAITVILMAVVKRKLTSQTRRKQYFPAWATIEIALTNIILSKGVLSKRLYSSIRKYGGSLFGITSGHQVLVNLPDADRLLSQSHHALSSEPIQYTLLTAICGAIDSPELEKKFHNSWKDLLVPIERQFVNDAAATAAIERSGVSTRAASFVTFSVDSKNLKRWERSANVQLLAPDLPDTPGIVEANLHSLTRDFGACLAIPILYGHEFFDRSARLLDDFWKFDNDIFPLLMMGIPPWTPFKMMKEGVAARSRLINDFAFLFRGVDKYQQGNTTDYGEDISDISDVALGRNKIYNRENWSYQDRGAAELTVLWGQNANTQPMLFWFLTYIYSTEGLLDNIRAEIAPYVSLSQVKQPEILSMNLAALSRDCQLLKSCLFETYRLAHEPASVRYLERPITIKDGTHVHELKGNTFITAAHSLIQRDASIYMNPDSFVPDRFLTIDPETEKPSVRYGHLRPWGSGAAMCKGRTFAEKEILALGAAIISLWDISPASGVWNLPDMIPGMGAKKPIHDIRVRIRRRVWS